MNATDTDKPDAPQGAPTEPKGRGAEPHPETIRDSRFAIHENAAGNPQAAVDALADPAPLTLGQVALLEKIKSPLLGGGEQTAADVIPGLYLLSLPSAQGAKHLKTLTEDAFAWADTLRPADFSRRWVAALKALRAFYALLPGPEGDAPKKASPATAG